MNKPRPTDPRRASTTRTTGPQRRPSPSEPDVRGNARRRQAEPQAPRRRAIITMTVAAVLAAVLVVVFAANSPTSTPVKTVAGAPMGPEGIPMETGAQLAPASTSATGQTVDGLQCDTSEQVAYHVHTHLSVYVNGRLRPIPAGVGIVEPQAEPTAAGAFDEASRCYYWLHVHAQDGVIHIESPTSTTYTLGQFFDLWGQPLAANQVGPATGRLTVFVDRARYVGDPRAITLGAHRDIQLDVGTPAPPAKAVDWSRSSL